MTLVWMRGRIAWSAVDGTAGMGEGTALGIAGGRLVLRRRSDALPMLAEDATDVGTLLVIPGADLI
jgi:hypothetical protein